MPPPGPAPSWSGQPLSLRPEPAAVREELPAAIWGAFGGSLRAACGGRDPRLHLRRSVRRAGTSRQRPEAEGSGAHCRGPRLSARTRLQGAESGGGEVSTAQSLTTKGHLKREARSNTLPRTRTYPDTPSPGSPRSQTLLPATASHPLASACGTNGAASSAPRRSGRPCHAPGPRRSWSVAVGVVRVRSVGLFSRVPLRENLRTASA